MTTTAERTAAAIAQELNEQKSLRAERAERMEATRAEVAAAREDRGRVSAAGESTDGLRRRIRDLEDQLGEDEDALPYIDARIGELEAELKDARREEAVVGFREAERRAQEALEEMDGALRQACRDLEPVRDRLRGAIEAADEAERGKTKQTGAPPHGVQAMLRQYEALIGLLTALRGFEEGDLTFVTALNSKRQTRTVW